LVGQEGVRLRFRLRTGSAGLFEDKKWCRMCDDERCVLCNSGEVEDVEHLLVRCEGFRWERQVLFLLTSRKAIYVPFFSFLPSSHTSLRINIWSAHFSDLNPPWASVKISSSANVLSLLESMQLHQHLNHTTSQNNSSIIASLLWITILVKCTM